jgi:hypothetical protein
MRFWWSVLESYRHLEPYPERVKEHQKGLILIPSFLQ